jgi:hypothetical protein
MNRGLLVTAGVLAGLAFASRSELQRYLRIRRMGADPSLVGVSVTPQGNARALRKPTHGGRS